MSRSTRDGFDQPVVLRIDSSSADEEETLFYAALQGVAGFPLDLFHAYTVEQHCDENVNFYRQVEEYREAPQIPTRDGIVDTFVKPGSPEELNINGKSREDVLRRQKEEEKEAHPGIFDRIQLEVVNLLRSDVYPRFQRKLETENLNETTAREALCLGKVEFCKEIVAALPGVYQHGFLGLACFIGTLLICSVVFALQAVCDPTNTSSQPEFCSTSSFFTNRLWRLLATPFIMGGVMFVQAGRTKFCPICAVTGASHLYKEPTRRYWTYIVTRTKADSRIVVKKVLTALRVRAGRKLAITMMITMIMSAILLFVPPNNPPWY